jgi:hypothetical protein
MPKPRIGVIPRTRLRDARAVRDTLKGQSLPAYLTISRGGFAVLVKSPHQLPREIDGIPIVRR